LKTINKNKFEYPKRIGSFSPTFHRHASAMMVFLWERKQAPASVAATNRAHLCVTIKRSRFFTNAGIYNFEKEPSHTTLNEGNLPFPGM